MWRLIWFFQGYVRAAICGASPEWALEKLSDARIAFLKPVRKDEFTIELLLRKKDVSRAQWAAERAMCELEIRSWHGLLRCIGGLAHRKIFVLLLALCMAGAVVIPKFVFFYEVVGNETVPDAQILRALQSLGVGFGTYGPSIRPQELKNKMLLLVPKLQWFTVQQSGMCARVIVRERPEKLPVEERRAPMNVVAGKDGVITSVSCLEGNCLCAPGQAVVRGQVLISAYTDLEFTTRVSAALGEIYAETLTHKQIAVPDTVWVKQPEEDGERAVFLIVGEKRWNIFGSSGNPGSKCDKITKTMRLRLPGGFELPLGLEIVECRSYAVREAQLDPTRAEQWAQWQLDQSIRQNMIAGKILEETTQLIHQDGTYTLDASVRCEEMIARMVRTSILKEETIP